MQISRLRSQGYLGMLGRCAAPLLFRVMLLTEIHFLAHVLYRGLEHPSETEPKIDSLL
jgi:hypothetical protein